MAINPFVFGKTVKREDFCNRVKDIEFLHHQFNSNSNTILISPRRWGKSSVVEEAASRYGKEDVRFVFVDLFKCRTPEDFYELFVQALLRSTNNQLDEAFQFASKFLKGLISSLSFQPTEGNEFSIKLAHVGSSKEDDILDLPQTIATKKKLRLVVCVDEFQNINHFSHPVEFQRKLRSYWQNHNQIHYCLYGSKRHLMSQLFESSDLPFYKFGAVLYLKKIEVDAWIPFIEKKFKKTGKIIARQQIMHLCNSLEAHPYYIQQICQILWYISSGKITDAQVEDSLIRLSEQNELQFQKTVDGLTTYQLNYLRALGKGGLNLHSKESVKLFSLGTSATILRSKDALLQKDIIDVMGKEITFVDPAFKWWFGRNF